MLLNKTNAHTHTQTLCHTRNSPDQIHTQTHTRNVWVFVAKQICSPPQSELGTVRHAFANSPALLLYSHIIGFSPNSSIHTHTWSSMLFLSYSLQHKMLLHYDGKCIRHNFPIDLVHFSNCHEFPPPLLLSLSLSHVFHDSVLRKRLSQKQQQRHEYCHINDTKTTTKMFNNMWPNWWNSPPKHSPRLFQIIRKYVIQHTKNLILCYLLRCIWCKPILAGLCHWLCYRRLMVLWTGVQSMLSTWLQAEMTCSCMNSVYAFATLQVNKCNKNNKKLIEHTRWIQCRADALFFLIWSLSSAQ